VSFTNIEFNAEKGEMNVSIKFNTEDFSLLFFHLYEKTIIPDNDHEFTAGQLDLVKNYINSSFSVVSGQDTVVLEYLRKEQDAEFITLYFKAPLPGDNSGNYVITNRLLLDLYFDQTNLVIVSLGAREWGLRFDYTNQRYEMAVLIDKT
jgi:hypothetical protein